MHEQYRTKWLAFVVLPRSRTGFKASFDVMENSGWLDFEGGIYSIVITEWSAFIRGHSFNNQPFLRSLAHTYIIMHVAELFSDISRAAIGWNMKTSLKFIAQCVWNQMTIEAYPLLNNAELANVHDGIVVEMMNQRLPVVNSTTVQRHTQIAEHRHRKIKQIWSCKTKRNFMWSHPR